MKRIIYQLLLFAMMLTVSFSCGDKNSESESECGDQKIVSNDAYYNLFSNPSIIYWGVTNGIRSFTYNYEYGNMCTKKNPKVQFFFTLVDANPVLSRLSATLDDLRKLVDLYQSLKPHLDTLEKAVFVLPIKNIMDIIK